MFRPDSKQLQQKALDTISQIDSISFIKFVHPPTWIDDAYLNRIPVDKIGETAYRHWETSDYREWLSNVLRSLGIHGEYIISFDSGGTFIQAKLDDNYDWIEPLWSVDEALDFLSLDFKEFVFIRYTERCPANDCMAVYVSHRPVSQ